MALPKELTTVTPVSKALALLLFIVLPFCAFFMGTNYQQMIDQSNKQQIITPITTQPTAVPIGHETPKQSKNVCTTDADCQNGGSCMTVGPIIANTTPQKVCVPKGEVAPM